MTSSNYELASLPKIHAIQEKASHIHYARAQQDHVLPKSRGGITTVPSCRRCNQSKGDKTPDEWLD